MKHKQDITCVNQLFSYFSCKYLCSGFQRSLPTATDLGVLPVCFRQGRIPHTMGVLWEKLMTLLQSESRETFFKAFPKLRIK